MIYFFLFWQNLELLCIFYTTDGEGLTFVLDRFDPGGGGTISCSGLTPGDISVPFEVCLTKVFHYPVDELIYHICTIVHTCMPTDVYSAVYKSTSYLFFILFEQMFGNTKENRHGSQSDYFNALKVRTFYKNQVMWSLRNNLFPIHFQRLCTMKYICFGAANVNIKFIEIDVVYYSLFSKRLEVKIQ